MDHVISIFFTGICTLIVGKDPLALKDPVPIVLAEARDAQPPHFAYMLVDFADIDQNNSNVQKNSKIAFRVFSPNPKDAPQLHYAYIPLEGVSLTIDDIDAQFAKTANPLQGQKGHEIGNPIACCSQTSSRPAFSCSTYVNSDVHDIDERFSVAYLPHKDDVCGSACSDFPKTKLDFAQAEEMAALIVMDRGTLSSNFAYVLDANRNKKWKFSGSKKFEHELAPAAVFDLHVTAGKPNQVCFTARALAAQSAGRQAEPWNLCLVGQNDKKINVSIGNVPLDDAFFLNACKEKPAKDTHFALNYKLLADSDSTPIPTVGNRDGAGSNCPPFLIALDTTGKSLKAKRVRNHPTHEQHKHE